MTRLEQGSEGGGNGRTGIIKLRLNLAKMKNDHFSNEISTVKTKKNVDNSNKLDSSSLPEKKIDTKDKRKGYGLDVIPPEEIEIQKDTKENLVKNDENMPPLKLTLNLKNAKEIVPTIKLSLKRPEEKQVDVETVDIGGGGGAVVPLNKRAKKTLDPLSFNVVSGGGDGKENLETIDNNNNNKVAVMKKEKKGPVKKEEPNVPLDRYSTIAAVRPVSFAGPKMPIPTFRSHPMTRVPIAALNPLTNMTPVEREEERIWADSLRETISGLWSSLANPNIVQPAKSYEELLDAIVPYWLMLAPIDITLNSTSLRPLIPLAHPEANKEQRITDEFKKLKDRLEKASMGIKNKEISTELLVLEQKLCLEEEKFLFAKLKKEYNEKVMEIMSRKRQATDSQRLLSQSLQSPSPQLPLPLPSQSQQLPPSQDQQQQQQQYNHHHQPKILPKAMSTDRPDGL